MDGDLKWMYLGPEDRGCGLELEDILKIESTRSTKI